MVILCRDVNVQGGILVVKVFSWRMVIFHFLVLALLSSRTRVEGIPLQAKQKRKDDNTYDTWCLVTYLRPEISAFTTLSYDQPSSHQGKDQWVFNPAVHVPQTTPFPRTLKSEYRNEYAQ